jgi:hypothetical protein
MGWNTLQAVQAMFLLSLCLKCHDQLSAGWSALSLCISMAASRGLNRPTTPQMRAEAIGKHEGETDRRRTWWTIYCFERFFSFELCKPSLISDDSCLGLELGSWSFSTDGKRHPRPTFLKIVGQLADLLGDIGRRAVQSRNAEEVAGINGINEAIKGKVRTISEVSAMLINWAEDLPDEYKYVLLSPGYLPHLLTASLRNQASVRFYLRRRWVPICLVCHAPIQPSVSNTRP